MKLPLSPIHRSVSRRFAPLAGLCILMGLSSGGAPMYTRLILAQHPAGYWRLAERPVANAVDSSPAQLHATYTFNSAGSPRAGQPGLPGINTNSMRFFNGPGGVLDCGYVTIPYDARLCPTNSDGLAGAPFSAECWLRPDVAQPSELVCPLAMAGPAVGGSYATVSGWSFYQRPEGLWELSMRTLSGAVNLVDSEPIVSNQWYHLAANWDGTNATLFVNGTARQSKLLTNYLANPGFSGAIGASPLTGDGGFVGAIAEVAIFTNALGPISFSNHFAIGAKFIGLKAVGGASQPQTNSVGP